jgi:hypothetical protein
MVDFDKLKKAVDRPPPASMPAPPGPSRDSDLPPPPKPKVPDFAGPEPRRDIQLPDIEPDEAQPRRALARVEEKTPETGMPVVQPKKAEVRLPDSGTKPVLEEEDLHGPSVFIKVDKYTDIVRALKRLKSHAMSLRDALDALGDIEKEIATGISIGHRAIDEFNNIIAGLDAKLLRAHHLDDFDVGSSPEMDEYIKNIYEQMEKIRNELKELS